MAQVLLSFPPARHRIRFAHARLGHLSRYLPQQAAYNKRLNAAGPLISKVIEALARQVSTWDDDLRLSDSTPLPCSDGRASVVQGDEGAGGVGGHGDQSFGAGVPWVPVRSSRRRPSASRLSLHSVR